jgi:uncharacterized protein YukE
MTRRLTHAVVDRGAMSIALTPKFTADWFCRISGCWDDGKLLPKPDSWARDRTTGMGDNLEVDPVDARASGEHVATHAANLLAGHAAAHERIATTQSGFIGESAAALAELAAHWQEESASHHRELCEHADNLRTAAAKYETTDTDEGSHLDAAASDLAERMSAGWG